VSVRLLVLFTRNLSRCTVIRSLKKSASSLKSPAHDNYVCVSAIVRDSSELLLHGVKHLPFVKVRTVDFELLLSLTSKAGIAQSV